MGTSAYFTTEDEKTELCYILDDFLNEYQKAYENYKKILGATQFEIMDTDYVKIFSVPRAVWVKMLKFSQEFDFDNGDSYWHIFNSNQIAIIVQHKNAKTYNTWILAETTKPSLVTTYSSHDGVDILWRIPSVTDFHEGSCWNAEITLNWLKDLFIPKVLDYYTSPKLSLLQLIIKKIKRLFTKIRVVSLFESLMKGEA